MSTKYAGQAVAALTVYLERGKNVLLLLAEEQFSAAEQLLMFREAAFHNFRAVDYLARQGEKPEGNSAYEAELALLHQEIDVVNKKLETALIEAKTDAETSLKILASAREKIKKFRSGNIIEGINVEKLT